jgi:carbonic anhydrase
MTDFAGMIEGYRRFHATDWQAERDRWAELAQGQSPKVMIVACSDSRVDPARIFDSNPGEVFVVRNVANLVPPFELGSGRHGVSAALEFAVTQLNVEEIVVMGHGGCGGIRAALTQSFDGCPPGNGGFIARWISMLDEPRDRVLAEHGPDATDILEREGIRTSIANLRTFPCIQEREAAGTISIKGAFFALEEGILYVLDSDGGEFRAIT